MYFRENGFKGIVIVQQKLTGSKVVSTKGLPFKLNLWYFFFTFKRNLLLKLQKKRFQWLKPKYVACQFQWVACCKYLKAASQSAYSRN
jgi:hypothetical protein